MDHRQTFQSVTAELVAAQDQLLALYELSNVMRRQTSLDAALQQLVKLTCRTMLAEKCVVRLEVPGRDRASAHYPDLEVGKGSLDRWFENEHDHERWTIRDSDKDEASVLLLPLELEGFKRTPPSDYIWFTQRVSYDDPCDEFKETLEKMRTPFKD